jgi:tRNA A-37 threonylcarbamoyl transferase component Bud32
MSIFKACIFWMMRTGAALILSLLRKLCSGIVLVPRVARKPAVLGRCLLTAHLAQTVLVLAILAMTTFLPAAVDAHLEKRYPPTVTKVMFGLRTDTRPDPRLEERKKTARYVLWSGSGGLVLCLFLLHVPRTVSRATARARQREDEADGLLASEPSASVLLYVSALSLATEPEHVTTLNEKLQIAEQRVCEMKSDQGAAQPANSEAGAKTIDMSWAPQRLPNNHKLEASQGPASSANVAGPNGRYCIQQEIGRGAMGIVFRAYDSVLAREVALKRLPEIMSDDENFSVRFQQEARTLARLNHPNIVHVYDFVQQDGQCWIAMELVEGEELDAMLKRTGSLRIDEAVRLSVQLAEALTYAHEHGVVHRDIKPANIMVTPEGVLKIGDFGLAKLAQSSLHTREGTVLGSPAYMSPEQAEGKKTDARSDIYAFGVTIYKLLSGHLPYSGGLETVIAQKLIKEPPSLRELNDRIPEQLDRLVMQMLAKDPEKRPSGMRACVEGLQAFANLSKKE